MEPNLYGAITNANFCFGALARDWHCVYGNISNSSTHARGGGIVEEVLLRWISSFRDGGRRARAPGARTKPLPARSAL